MDSGSVQITPANAAKGTLGTDLFAGFRDRWPHCYFVRCRPEFTCNARGCHPTRHALIVLGVSKKCDRATGSFLIFV